MKQLITLTTYLASFLAIFDQISSGYAEVKRYTLHFLVHDICQSQSSTSTLDFLSRFDGIIAFSSGIQKAALTKSIDSKDAQFMVDLLSRKALETFQNSSSVNDPHSLKATVTSVLGAIYGLVELPGIIEVNIFGFGLRFKLV